MQRSAIAPRRTAGSSRRTRTRSGSSTGRWLTATSTPSSSRRRAWTSTRDGLHPHTWWPRTTRSTSSRAREPPQEPLPTLGRLLPAREGSGAALRTRRIGVAVSRGAGLAAQEGGAEQRRLGAVAEERLQAATRGARQVAREPGVTEGQFRADDVDLVLLDPAARLLRLGACTARAVRVRSRGLSVCSGVRTA